MNDSLTIALNGLQPPDVGEDISNPMDEEEMLEIVRVAIKKCAMTSEGMLKYAKRRVKRQPQASAEYLLSE